MALVSCSFSECTLLPSTTTSRSCIFPRDFHAHFKSHHDETTPVDTKFRDGSSRTYVRQRPSMNYVCECGFSHHVSTSFSWHHRGNSCREAKRRGGVIVEPSAKKRNATAQEPSSARNRKKPHKPLQKHRQERESSPEDYQTEQPQPIQGHQTQGIVQSQPNHIRFQNDLFTVPPTSSQLAHMRVLDHRQGDYQHVKQEETKLGYHTPPEWAMSSFCDLEQMRRHAEQHIKTHESHVNSSLSRDPASRVTTTTTFTNLIITRRAPRMF
ncbi:hypothetical protein B0O80DRAFT_463770 [Mortierella sp. GBAus27b]|nr:hypothetical protein B0O80DRAFT_463770 [Mortierella sp. GBAus27b]